MICRYCGMDSRNPQVCEWCHKQLAAGSYQPHTAGPPAMDLTQPQGYAPPPPVNLAQPPGYAPPPAVNLSQPPGAPPPPSLPTPSYMAPPPSAPAAPVNPANLSQPMGHNFGQVAAPQAHAPAPSPMDLTQPVGAPAAPLNFAQPAPPAPLGMTQPIPSGLNMTQPVPQQQFRTSLTGEVIAVEPEAPPPGYGQPGMPTHAVVRPGHTGHVLPPSLAGLPGRAIGTDLAKTTAGTYMTPMSQRWEKALAISFPILLVSVWIVHLKPTMLPWVSLADFFFVAMALGGTASINSYDDEYLDVGAALMISILFGPTVGLVGYVIVGALKQDFNVAIIALLASHILIRIILLAAFPMNAGVFTVLPTLMVFTGVGLMSICLTFGGWMLSSFFRPLNE